MSHLWIKNTDAAWQDHLLEADLLALAPEGPKPLVVHEQLRSLSESVLVKIQGARGLEGWMLLCPPSSRVLVNGLPVTIGVRLLSHRDAVTLGTGHRLFFSSEQVAQIVPFTGSQERTCCVRCKLPIVQGTPAVRCPAPDCGLWYHQTSDQPCWTYTEHCAACGHPTDLNAGLQWTPEEL